MSKIYIEPPSLERRYRKLAKLGAELGIPVTECFLEVQVTMLGGKVIHHHKQRSHSWTRWAYNHLFMQICAKDADETTYGAGHLGMREIGGSGKGNAAPFSFGPAANAGGDSSLRTCEGTSYGLRAAGGTANQGIVVGTGNTAESFEEYKLATPIANGVGAGQMSYVLSEPMNESYNAGTKTKTNTLLRYINNNSGGEITVAEVGLYGKMESDYQHSGTFIFSRDVLGPAVTVPNSGQLKITYTISLVYPA